MIKVMIGEKGSGKTKALLSAVDEALGAQKGSIVFINKGERHVYQLSHEVRLINSEEYDIDSYRAFYGLLCGIISQNFDITNIFVDSVGKIVKGGTSEELDAFLDAAAALSEKFGIEMFFTISMKQELATETISKYAI